MISKTDFEVDSICEEIIKDHILFMCCPETFKICMENSECSNKDLENLVLRKKIQDLVCSKDSLKALEIVKDEGLKKLLLKQGFIELVSQNKLEEALKVAEEYLNRFEDDEVFSILGYKNLDEDRIQHYFSEESLAKFLDTLNETLFYRVKNRSASLMSIAWFHYRSIQLFLNK